MNLLIQKRYLQNWKLKSRICFVFLVIGTSITSFSQNTFTINRSHLDTIFLERTKTFIVSKDFDPSTIGQKIQRSSSFTPDSNDVALIEKTLKTQYYKAAIKKNKIQWRELKKNKKNYDWSLALKQHKEQKKKLKKSFFHIQNNDLDNYDRYLFGYFTDSGLKVILVLFDPHKIAYFILADEQHIKNLSPVFYIFKKKRLEM